MTQCPSPACLTKEMLVTFRWVHTDTHSNSPVVNIPAFHPVRCGFEPCWGCYWCPNTMHQISHTKRINSGGHIHNRVYLCHFIYNSPAPDIIQGSHQMHKDLLQVIKANNKWMYEYLEPTMLRNVKFWKLTDASWDQAGITKCGVIELAK